VVTSPGPQAYRRVPKSETVLTLLPFAVTTSVSVWSTAPSPLRSTEIDTVLPSALVVVTDFVLQRALALLSVIVSVRGAVTVKNRNVGAGLVRPRCRR